MKLLFGIYQYLIAFPILVVLTIITAILTLIGSPLFHLRHPEASAHD